MWRKALGVISFCGALSLGATAAYLVNGITLADIAVAGPFANLRHLGIALDETRYPKTIAYTARILSRPSFAPWIERESALLAKLAA